MTIAVQTPKSVRIEQAFAGHHPMLAKGINKDLENEYSFDFGGIGFIVEGEAKPKNRSSVGYESLFAFNTELYVDGKKIETAKLPVNFTHRRYDLFWKYQLPKGKHTVCIKLLNSDNEHVVRMSELLVYDNQPLKSKL